MPLAATNIDETTPVSITPKPTYVFDNAWLHPRVRMQSAGSYLDPWTTAQLESIGISAGWSCLEAGAAPDLFRTGSAHVSAETGK
jgi:hypothetical protein